MPVPSLSREVSTSDVGIDFIFTRAPALALQNQGWDMSKSKRKHAKTDK
jgi:hypothetical protein